MPLDAVAGGGRATLHPRQNQACQRCSGGTEGGGIGTKCWFLWGMHSVIDSIPRRKSRSVKTRNQSTVLCGQLWPRGVTGVGGVMKQIEFGFRIPSLVLLKWLQTADSSFMLCSLFKLCRFGANARQVRERGGGSGGVAARNQMGDRWRRWRSSDCSAVAPAPHSAREITCWHIRVYSTQRALCRTPRCEHASHIIRCSRGRGFRCHTAASAPGPSRRDIAHPKRIIIAPNIHCMLSMTYIVDDEMWP
jgi:hypothetical protein